MLPTHRPPTHPGEMLLKEFLEPLGVSQVEAAGRMNIPFQRLNAIVRGRRGVSADTALLLEGLTGWDAQIWLMLQSKWDLWHAMKARARRPKVRPLRKTAGALALIIVMVTAAEARAQGYISAMYGFNFGGVSGCPELAGCADKQKTYSLAGGGFGTIFGAEAEVAYTPDFFGEAPGLSSRTLTMMGNVMLGPRAGPVRPYLLAGAGIMRPHFELRTANVLTMDDTVLGYAIGGGVFAFLGDHFGVRADLRYFHSFPDVIIAGITLASEKLNYSRISAGVVIQF